MHTNTRATLSSSTFSPSHSWEITEALGNGIEGLRRHWKVLLPATLIVSFLGEGLSWALTSAGDALGGAAETTLDIANGGVSLLLCMVLTAGFLRITLDAARGRTPELRSFMSSAGSALGLLGTYLIMGIAVVGGLCALIIPGLIAAVGLSFAPLLVVDRKLGPVEALRESWHLLNGSKLKLLGFSLLCGAIALVLMIPAGMMAAFAGPWLAGVLVMVPMLLLSAVAGVSQAWIYLRLLGVQR